MSFKIDIRQMVKCSESDLDTGALVLAKAFKDDVPVNALIGHMGFDTLLAFYRAILAATAIGGIVYFAYKHDSDGSTYRDTTSDSVVGVGLWFQPGHDIFSGKEQREAGFDQVFATFPPELARWWKETYRPRFTVQLERALGKEGRLNLWHLQLIGVLPEMQRKGVGAALVKVGEERAKIDRKPIVLTAATPDNVEKFYKKLGYRIKPSGPPEHPEFEEYTDFEGNVRYKIWYMVKEFEDYQ